VRTLEFETSRKYQLLNITSEIENLVSESEVEDGACLIFAPHATAGVVLEENEGGLKRDFVQFFKDLAEKEGWHHDRIDDNASAHLLAGVLGQSQIIPISQGRLARGTWQDILLVELDGPRRSRKVHVTILS